MAPQGRSVVARPSSVAAMTSGVDEQLRTSLDRLVDRLRSLPASRLDRALPGREGKSLTETTVEVSTWCVAAEAAVVGRGQDPSPQPHPLPAVAPLSCGDQLRVVAYDLLTALADWTDDTTVLLEGRPVDRTAVTVQLRDRLVELRAVS